MICKRKGRYRRLRTQPLTLSFPPLPASRCRPGIHCSVSAGETTKRYMEDVPDISWGCEIYSVENATSLQRWLSDSGLPRRTSVAKNSVIHGKEAGIANHYCPSLQNSVMQQEVGEILISLLCNKCVTPHVTSVIRFWVELAVDDGKDSAMFVVFDREMTKLTKQEAVVLALEEIPNGGDEELPSCLGELARKEFFFKFVSHFSISPYLHCMINYH
uniref:Replication factor A C-terminal domain-containing protein n=1 Tax=Brassica oleracea TaxID=3712 RepID=A0A3P6GRY3_BRAOL|nr:unnamed protein product [Brassica oleracea]